MPLPLLPCVQQAMGTCLALTLCHYYSPSSPDRSGDVAQAWLQEFAWTAAALPYATAQRNAKLSDSPALTLEPMFCVETAIKLMCVDRKKEHVGMMRTGCSWWLDVQKQA